MSHIHLWMHIPIFQKVKWKKIPMPEFMYIAACAGLSSGELSLLQLFALTAPGLNDTCTDKESPESFEH
jgi:hypothetical protein